MLGVVDVLALKALAGLGAQRGQVPRARCFGEPIADLSARRLDQLVAADVLVDVGQGVAGDNQRREPAA